jgi:hypothetical protein
MSGGPSLQSTVPGVTVQLRLSPTIRNEYLSRCVFHGEGEWPEVPSRARVVVPLATARAMLDDAEYNSGTGAHDGQGPDEIPASVARAYRALAEQIRRALYGGDPTSLDRRSHCGTMKK